MRQLCLHPLRSMLSMRPMLSVRSLRALRALPLMRFPSRLCSLHGKRRAALAAAGAALLLHVLPVHVQAAPSPAIGTRIDMGDFLIDATEVTIGQFAAHAARRKLVTAAEREGGGFEFGAGWERRPGWSYRAPYGRPGAADEPAVHLSWPEAKAYCEDAGGALPTRAQWAAAAYTERRGNPPAPLQGGRTYPYPTGETAAGANTSAAGDPWQRHAPAGKTAVGVNGLYDMGANVWEWLLDAQGDERLTAGGSWWYDASKMRQEGMQYKPAAFYAVYVGFRCVYPRQAQQAR